MTKVLDLFGNEVLERTDPPKGKRRYDAKGYAAPPGTGPAGETCKSCANAHKVNGGVRDYWKCALLKPTHGPGTDIRLRSPACRWWKKS